ncbi:wall associated protein, partial [Pseudoxanthomonas sacheonensis]
MLLFFHVSASAQTAGKFAWQETGQRLKASQAVSPLGPDFAGDQVQLSNGALSFSATDVSLPGNDSLPLAFSRSYTVMNRKDYYSEDMLADWSVDLPNINAVHTPDWNAPGASPGSRCSVAAPPALPGGGYTYEDYWQGLNLDLPGSGGDVLVAKPAIAKPSSGGPYPWVTGDGKTHIACLSTVLNATGEGFIATTADGTRYWFNWMAQYRMPDMKGNMLDVNGHPVYAYQTRRKNALYATRVEDRFGNWVTYTYSNAWNAPARMTGMQASDGRQLTVSYSGSFVSSVSDGTRSWNYAYADTSSGRKTLSSVTLPDGSAWNIGFAEFTNAEIKYNEAPTGEILRSCTNPETPLNASLAPVGTLKHPAGALGTFTVNIQKHGRSNVPVSCGHVTTYPVGAPAGSGNNTTDDVNLWANSDNSFTLLKKGVSGPGLAAAEWNYSYVPGISSYRYPGTTIMYPVCNWSAYNCALPHCTSDSCAGSSKTTVTGPNGKWIRYTYGNSYRYNEGKLLKVEEGTGETAVLRTVENAYDLSGADQAYPASYGSSLKPGGDGFTAEYHRPLLQAVTSQDGATFSSSVDLCGAVRCFDAFAQQTSATKSSSLGFSKQESYEYENNTGKWVIGQVKKITVNGIVAAQVGYDPVTA